MTFKNAPQNKPGKPTKAAPPPAITHATPVGSEISRPLLGFDVSVEYLPAVPLCNIVSRTSESDRVPRPGDEERLKELAQSIREIGVRVPVMLEALSDGRYWVVYGRRRIAAARMLGLGTIKAEVVPPLGEDVRRTIIATENIQRQDLTPPEEYLAVADLIRAVALNAAVQLGKPLNSPGGLNNRILTPDMLSSAQSDSKMIVAWRNDVLLDHRVRSIAYELVAAMLAKPVTWVRDRAYIGRLSEAGQKLVREGKLPLAHAREIAKVADAAVRDELAKDYAAGGSASVSDTEAGRLMDLQEQVRRRVFALHTVPWKRDVPFADQRACVGCPHNSQAHPCLFEHGGMVSTEMHAGMGRFASSADKISDAGVCTLSSCYESKHREARRMLAGAAKAIVENKGRPASRFMDAAEKVLEFKAIELRVKERRDAIKNRTHSHNPKKVEKDPAQQKREAIDEARRQWQYAIEKWAGTLEPKLAAKLAKTPGSWVMFHLLTESPIFQATRNSNEKARAKALNDPRLARAINLAAGGASMASIIELEKLCGRNLNLINGWYDGKSGWAEMVAKTWGIDHDAPPKVDDFLPAEFGGKKKPAEKPRPAAGKPAKPGTKSKAVSRVARAGGEDGTGE